MSQNILGIKSKYNLKSIFAMVDYDRLLKIIKYNKKVQKCLGINIINYEERSDYQFIIKDKRRKIHFGPDNYFVALMIGICILVFFSIILFIFILIYASLLASKGAFDENNTKDNYNKNYSKIIDKINLSLFGFSAYIIISFFLGSLFGGNFLNSEKRLTKIICIIIIIMIDLSYLVYEVIIIIKLYLSYKIKKNKITWFMKCDYVLIIFMFLILSDIIFMTITRIMDVEDKRKIKEKYNIVLAYLIKFRDIEIINFQLPRNFTKMDDYKMRKFILNNKYRFSVNSIMNEYILSLINNFRKENLIKELSYDDTNNFKDLIFDKYSEPIIFKDKNIFKLSNMSYLLKYPYNEFETRFYKRERNITNIILNDYLDKIIIIEKKNILYIFLFNSYNELIRLRNIRGQYSEFRGLLWKMKDNPYNFELDKYYDW